MQKVLMCHTHINNYFKEKKAMVSVLLNKQLKLEEPVSLFTLLRMSGIIFKEANFQGFAKLLTV